MARLFKTGITSEAKLTSVGLETSSGITITGANSPLVLGSNHGAAGQVLTSQGTANTPTWTTISGGGGSGTVTSVGLSLPSILTVSNSPVTTTGTLTATLATQNAGKVFAGPVSGADATPTFRPIAADDFYQYNTPSIGQVLSAAPVTGGFAWKTVIDSFGGSITGTLNHAGASSPIQLNSQAGTTGQVLTSAGAGNTPTWSTLSGAYTVISSGSGNGAFSFSSLSSAAAGYRKIVLQFVVGSTGGTGFSGNLVLGVNNFVTTPYTMYNVGSTTATVSTSATSVPIATGVTAGNKITIEFPNWDGGTPTIYISGGTGATASQSRWGVASTQSAIDSITITASTSWGNLPVTYALYGVK